MTWAIIQGGVLETLAKLPENLAHGVLCDPPYGYSFMGKEWDYDVPSVAEWGHLSHVMRPGAPLLSFGGSRTFHRVACGIEDAGLEIRDVLTWLYAKGFPKSKQFPCLDGLHGTALKPAWEPIVFARKPLDDTYEKNMDRWGTGLLDIDGTRPNGRWPANLVLDEEAGALLDATVGDRPSRKSVTRNGGGNQGGAVYTERTGEAKPDTGFEETGGPSRFFFSTKVSTKERELGCEDIPVKSAGEMTERVDGQKGLENPRAGAGRISGARNNHPTLKPIALAQWLARLILPTTDWYFAACAKYPAQRVLLVPWAGAGSEMIGALQAGWDVVIGIERDPEYIQIAKARLRHWCPEHREES